MKKFKDKKGITLIALVVTIIVLLILAGISIMMLTGQNGILNRAGEAKEKTGVAQIDENVKLAVADALTKGTGSITRDNLEEALNKYVGEGNYNLEDDSDGWIISAGGKKYHVSSTGGITEDNNGGNGEISISDIYSELGITEDDIASEDLFEYNIIDENAKTAEITGIKEQYCVSVKTKEDGYTEYYGISEELTNNGTIVVPYKYVNEEGKEYTIVKACVNSSCRSYNSSWDRYEMYDVLPNNIKTLIFPNTIYEITGGEHQSNITTNETLTKVVLPNKLKKIGGFSNCITLSNIELPDTITEIENGAFYSTAIENIKLPNNIEKIGYGAFASTKIKEVDIPKGIKELGSSAFSTKYIEKLDLPDCVTQIGDYEFFNCSALKEITIPSNVTTIGEKAFEGDSELKKVTMKSTKLTEIKENAFKYCSGINEITMPSTVTFIGSNAFYGWGKSQIVNIQLRKADVSESIWKPLVNDSGCKATIKYLDDNT